MRYHPAMSLRAFFVLTTLLVSNACGGDSSSGAASCATHYDCPAGESCGTLDGTTYACHVSGTSKAGDSCNANQGLPLQCSDRLFCLGINDVGTCRFWCDASNPCPAGNGTCTSVQTTRGATLGVCF